MSEQTRASTIEANVPARLDRLPWSRFHRRVFPLTAEDADQQSSG